MWLVTLFAACGGTPDAALPDAEVPLDGAVDAGPPPGFPPTLAVAASHRVVTRAISASISGSAAAPLGAIAITANTGTVELDGAAGQAGIYNTVPFAGDSVFGSMVVTPDRRDIAYAYCMGSALTDVYSERVGGRDGDGHRARGAVGMRMRGLGRAERLGADAVEIVREVRADRRGSHRRAVAERPLTAEQRTRLGPPSSAPANAIGQPVGAVPVAAIRVCAPASYECVGERVRVDLAVRSEHLDDGQRHRRVIGPAPWPPRRDQSLGRAPRAVLRRSEHRLAERVTNREAEQREPSALQTSAGVGDREVRVHRCIHDTINVEAPGSVGICSTGQRREGAGGRPLPGVARCDLRSFAAARILLVIGRVEPVT